MLPYLTIHIFSNVYSVKVPAFNTY